MNILYIQFGNPWNPHCHGGVAYLNHDILIRLAKRHQVTVWTGPIVKEFSPLSFSGVNYVQRCWTTNKWISRLSYMILSALTGKKGFDLVNLVWERYAPVLIDHRKIPVVFEVHSNFFVIPSKIPVLEPLSQSLFTLACRRYEFATAISTEILELMRGIKKNFALSEVISIGIDEALLSRSPAKAEEYFLYLGRLDLPVKRIDVLIQAYQRSRVDLPLVIAGDGKDREQVRALIDQAQLKDKIRMAGWVSGEEKDNLLRHCMAVCLTSRSEGSPVILVEALAFGKPVIATRVGGIPDIVQHNETGILVESDDVDGLARALKTLAENRALREAMQKKAFIAARRFSFGTAVQQRERIFQKVFDDHASHS